MTKKNRIYNVFPGSLPVDDIYSTLGIDVDAGDVIFTVPAQRHALRRHPQDVPVITPHLSGIIESPMYMGDDLRNPGKIEFVSKIRGHSGGALVAIAVEKNTDGYYHICSAYLISDSEFDKKKSKRILKFVRPR
jgi:hypothetical protein